MRSATKRFETEACSRPVFQGPGWGEVPGSRCRPFTGFGSRPMGRHRNRDGGAVPSKQARALVGGSGQPPKTADHRVVGDMEQRRELGWLSRQVRVVVVGDREIDVHRLFEQQVAHAGEAGGCSCGCALNASGRCGWIAGCWGRG